VVVPTHDRPALVARLVEQLGRQQAGLAAHEIIVVDDGSATPVRPVLERLELGCELRVQEQPNAGAAAARHRGALAARGEILVFVDDDMQVGPGFLAAHLRAHPTGSRKVVLGQVRPPPDLERMPLFERWHQWTLQSFGDRLLAGARPAGNNLYTGNVSLRREDYLAVGGFDPSLPHSEDAELGLRLEQAGVTFEFSAAASTVNGSDRSSLSCWRRRAALYGVCDTRIGRKHAQVRHASPWRFWPELHPISRPILLASAVVPPLSRGLSRAVYAAADASDRLGARRLALAGTTLAYGLEYYRGVREELGSARALLEDLRAYRRSAGAGGPRADLLERFRAAVEADHAMGRHYQERYGNRAEPAGSLARDAVQKIGFQILVAVRLMRLLRDARLPLAAKVASRTIRHLYGSDVHWDAELEPGVVLVHGMGLAISAAAHVSEGCILFQNVTLGMGIDPVTRRTGAPRLEPNVHVMPGATLLGPITVGEGSKVAAGVVLMRSVPPRSLVAGPEPSVKARADAPPRREADLEPLPSASAEGTG
jgi:serine acetyltransferase/GT2 family glycosyltransferase